MIIDTSKTSRGSCLISNLDLLQLVINARRQLPVLLQHQAGLLVGATLNIDAAKVVNILLETLGFALTTRNGGRKVICNRLRMIVRNLLEIYDFARRNGIHVRVPLERRAHFRRKSATGGRHVSVPLKRAHLRGLSLQRAQLRAEHACLLQTTVRRRIGSFQRAGFGGAVARGRLVALQRAAVAAGFGGRALQRARFLFHLSLGLGHLGVKLVQALHGHRQRFKGGFGVFRFEIYGYCVKYRGGRRVGGRAEAAVLVLLHQVREDLRVLGHDVGLRRDGVDRVQRRQRRRVRVWNCSVNFDGLNDG